MDKEAAARVTTATFTQKAFAALTPTGLCFPDCAQRDSFCLCLHCVRLGFPSKRPVLTHYEHIGEKYVLVVFDDAIRMVLGLSSDHDGLSSCSRVDTVYPRLTLHSWRCYKQNLFYY